MPIWSKEEMMAINDDYPDSSNWEARYDVLGGIPRTVFERIELDPEGLIRDASDFCRISYCTMVGSNSFRIHEKSKVMHSLIHITSTAPYTQPSVLFASDRAIEIFCKIKETKERSKMFGLLSLTQEISLVSQIRGKIFELYVIGKLEQGGQFSCRALSTNKRKHDSVAQSNLVIPPSAKISANGVSADHIPNQLYVPENRNHPAIDAWMPGIGLFQITINERHTISNMIHKDLKNCQRSDKKLYWFVPSKYYSTFTSKEPHSIDQYVVGIEYPDPSYA
jgi:hypothetical protein